MLTERAFLQADCGMAKNNKATKQSQQENENTGRPTKTKQQSLLQEIRQLKKKKLRALLNLQLKKILNNINKPPKRYGNEANVPK